MAEGLKLDDRDLRVIALSHAVDLHKVYLERGDIKCTIELQLEDIQTTAAIFTGFLKGETK